MDLDPLRSLSNPLERSAAHAAVRFLRALGHEVVVLPSPETQPVDKRPSPELTVDLHLRIDAVHWYIDHTVLPLPDSEKLPAAVEEAANYLNLALRAPVGLSMLGGMRLSVTPQVDVPRKARERYYQRLIQAAHQALDTGLPVFDAQRPKNGPYPMPLAQPCAPADPGDPLMLCFEAPVAWGSAASKHGWTHDVAALHETVGRVVRKKLGNQLSRARSAVTGSAGIGLLLDVRRDIRPGDPVLALPADVTAALIKVLAAEQPGILDRAWLLNDDGLVVVYDNLQLKDG